MLALAKEDGDDKVDTSDNNKNYEDEITLCSLIL